MSINNLLVNVRKTEEVCYCPTHRGDKLQQIDAQLPNGRPVRILRDSGGYHVSIGRGNWIGEPDCPDPISAAEVERMLRQAAQG